MASKKQRNRWILMLLFFTQLTINQSVAQSSINFQYDNDLFTQTDQYYTQGIRWQYTTTQLKRFWLNRIPIKLPERYQSITYRGFQLQHAVFTPTDLGVAQPLTNDRPYAGYLTLAYNRQQIDTSRQQSLTTQVQIGILGPPAFAEGMQKTIHDIVNGEQPQGWDNQITTEVILGYQVRYEKAILGKINRSHIYLFGQAQLSNLLTRALLGTGFKLQNRSSARFRLQFTGSSHLEWIGYNATLQGGIFNRSSPNTITPSQLKRWIFHHQLGGLVGWGNYHLGYTLHLISPEFSLGESHRWGSLIMKVQF